jgi:uncharacterized protein involved in exopolysaccharide biosynthesis
MPPPPQTANNPKVDQGAMDVTLGDVMRSLWDGRWLILATTSAALLVGLIYLFVATPWYRADVLLSPADESTPLTLPGAIGGLAQLANMNVGSSETIEALAILGSRDFIRGFIVDHGLMPILFQDQWDSEAGKWNADERNEGPDLREGVYFFQQEVMSLEEDAATGLITLSIDWTDPVLAAEWSNLLVERVNGHLRDKALAESTANVEYLQGELAKAKVITLQQTISGLLENELQKLMVARGNAEFAFRILDRAEVPHLVAHPNRILVVFVALFAGMILGGLAQFLRVASRT